MESLHLLDYFSYFLSNHMHISELWSMARSLQKYRFLDIFLVFHGWLPLLERPKERISFQSRFIWTVLVSIVFLIMEQFPMYGVNSIAAEEDYFAWLRPSILSTPGSLLELAFFPTGISTIVIFFMDDVFDLLDPYLQQYHYDEVLQETARMVITMLVTLGISIAYTASGLLKIYPGNFTPFLVIIQLFLSSSVIHLLNQILDEYGICGIFSLSTAIHTSRTIFWQAFSPTLRHTEEGSMFEGSVLFFLNSLSSWESKKRAIEESFFRGYQPNLKTLGVSIFILIFIFYLKSLRVEIPVRLRNDPTIRGSYVIKLLYYEPKVLLFQYHFISEVMMLSQVKHIFFSELNWRVLNFLGTWQQSQSILIPVSGICYWLTPPTWSKLFKDPLQVSVYICYILLTSAIFSHLSVNKNDYEDNPESVIEDLLGPTDLTMAGKFEDSDEALRQEIRRVIPIATVLGGLMWGLIWILSDILEVTGGGQGMLLIAETIYRIYEAWVAEKNTLVAMR